MPSTLIVSHDPAAVRAIEQNAMMSSVQTKAIGAVESAEHWLATKDFDALLLDDHGNYNLTQIVHTAWARNPHMVAGVFSLSGTVRNPGAARIAGLEVFQFPHALQDLRMMFDSLSSMEKLRPNTKILVVDDLDAPRGIMCAFIEGLGFGGTVGVGSVNEALKILRENPNEFFCIVTDVNMPKLGGADLIRSVRDDTHLAHLPIIVLTAHASADNLRPSLVAGASGVLVKPPKKKDLIWELTKAQRILVNHQDPRLCRAEEPDDLLIIEDALSFRLC